MTDNTTQPSDEIATPTWEADGWRIEQADAGTFVLWDDGLERDIGVLSTVEVVALHAVLGTALRATGSLCENCGTAKTPEREHSPNSMGSCIIGVRMPPPDDDYEEPTDG